LWKLWQLCQLSAAVAALSAVPLLTYFIQLMKRIFSNAEEHAGHLPVVTKHEIGQAY